MKTLTLVLLLSCSSALLLPEAAAQSDGNGWGPGEPGECVVLQNGDVRFTAGSYRVVGNSVYELERGDDCFIKIIDLPFLVLGIDHVGWTWDGFLLFWSDQAAYRCEVNGDSLEQIMAYGLLSGFLFNPIERASGMEVHSGCFHHNVNEVDHDVVESSLPSLLYEVRPGEDESKGGRQINGIDLEELTWALRSVDIDPWRAPSADELELDEGDLQAYAERVAADIEDTGTVSKRDFFGPIPTPDNRDIFTDLPAILDTLKPEAIRAALVRHRAGWFSTSSSFFGVTLINTVGDTLHCSFASDGPMQPFCLPWTLRYGDAEFQTYSVELARLLMGLLPENEYRSEREQKIDVLYAIAEYLGEVRSRRGGSASAQQ